MDLKMVNFPSGQGGHIKYPCFSCYWNSRNSFGYISSICSGLSYEKINARMFDGPQSTTVLNDHNVVTAMTAVETRVRMRLLVLCITSLAIRKLTITDDGGASHPAKTRE